MASDASGLDESQAVPVAKKQRRYYRSAAIALEQTRGATVARGG